MILEFVTFHWPPDMTREQIVAEAKTTIAKWAGNRELLRKHFIRGFGDTAGMGGGVYIWPSVAAAKAGHNEEWRAWVKARTGAEPTIQYFDLFMLIDNESGAVTEYPIDGAGRDVVNA